MNLNLAGPMRQMSALASDQVTFHCETSDVCRHIMKKLDEEYFRASHNIPETRFIPNLIWP